MNKLVLLFCVTISISIFGQSDNLIDFLNKGTDAIQKYNSSHSSNDHFEMGSNYFNRGNYRAAIGEYSKHIKYYPSSAEAYCNRGLCKARLGDYQSASSDFTNAIKLNSNLAEAYLNRGVMKARLNNYRGACADFRKANDLGLYCQDLIDKTCNR
jgi:tetratricopeptide (TPR) repeat protein